MKSMRGWLEDMRKTAGLLQEDMAERLAISQPYYSEIERGGRQKDMTYSMMERLAGALGRPVQDIIDAERAAKNA